MTQACDVGIVGAGPYGLSLAAFLGAAGVSYRIFGTPMQFWRQNVPPGTFLKSDGNSSDLAHPDGALRVGDFFMHRDGHFSMRAPIAVERFIEYGETFQARFVPAIDRRDISGIARTADGFRLTTQDGATVLCRRVALAVGINAFRSLPAIFDGIGGSLVSHSAQFGPVAHLAGKRVAVIGSGASAIDIAAVAHDAGAHVTIISGRERIIFHSPPSPPSIRDRILHPDTGIGAGWSKMFYVKTPDLFRRLPASARMKIVSTALGASPGWFMKERIVGRVPVLAGRVPVRATVAGGRVRLEMRQGDTFEADHVVAATGYRVDMKRLGLLHAQVLAAIRTYRGSPVLSSHFETSLPGFYIVGPAASFSFGPVMRFVYGARFAAPRAARHMVRGALRGAAVAPAAARELVPAE